MKKTVFYLFYLFSVCVIAQERGAPFFASTINEEDLQKHLFVLASDSLEGRETGHKGQKLAADYIARHFKSIGILPYNRESYYQVFPLLNKKIKTPASKQKRGEKKSAEGNSGLLKGENVLGYIEGGDLKEELLVITAHYDHLGVDRGKINNGADDNGSGTAAILEMAEAFALAKKEGKGPRRSVLFMLVDGEEKGLLGSAFYTENPVFPLENTIANLNIDMIGRMDKKHEGNPDYIYLIGSDKLSTELHQISEEANAEYTHLEIDYTFNAPKDPNRFYYRSDHYNFAKNNIPVIFYFNGVHADYHKPTDTIEKIHFAKISKITKLIFHTAWQLVNQDKRIEVDVESDFKNKR